MSGKTHVLDIHKPNTAFNEFDPHGEPVTHEHHVSSALGLRFILSVLLFFTVLTVAISRAEIWFGEAFHTTLPDWVNVGVAMSIAVVKAILVLLYFMHLRHDNPINSVIFGVTCIAFCIFLSFTFMDINNRGYVDDSKRPTAVSGGSGIRVTMNAPSYANVTLPDGITVYDGTPLYIGAVELRYSQIEAAYIGAVHAPMIDAREKELIAAPTQVVRDMVEKGKDKPTLAVAARRAAFNDTLAAAKEIVMSKVREDLAHEFEHHLEHAALPHHGVLKKLAEKLGPELYAKVIERAGHGADADVHASTANASQAKKGLTPGLYDAPSAPGTHPPAGSGH